MPPRPCACCWATCSPRGANTGSPPAATRGIRHRRRCWNGWACGGRVTCARAPGLKANGPTTLCMPCCTMRGSADENEVTCPRAPLCARFHKPSPRKRTLSLHPETTFTAAVAGTANLLVAVTCRDLAARPPAYSGQAWTRDRYGPSERESPRTAVRTPRRGAGPSGRAGNRRGSRFAGLGVLLTDHAVLLGHHRRRGRRLRRGRAVRSRQVRAWPRSCRRHY